MTATEIETQSTNGDRTGTLRQLLLGLVLLTTIGLTVELVLLEHTESFLQIIPFLALAFGFAASAMLLMKATRIRVQLFRGVMALLVVVGTVGVYLHLRGNFLFELEIDPAGQGWPVIREALQGATPTMAPGAMAQLGLLGLATTFRHPTMRSRRSKPDNGL
jgi:hypothetical protein